MADSIITVAFPGNPQSSGMQPAFIPFDAIQPGTTAITITNVPRYFRVVSAWMTERYPNGPLAPKIGSAILSTSSVQFDATLGTIRIICSSNWNSPLAAAAMLILG